MSECIVFLHTIKPYRKWLKHCFRRGIKTVLMQDGTFVLKWKGDKVIGTIGYAHRTTAQNALLVWKRTYR